MKIGDVVFAAGLSGYFNKDLQAVKAGAKPNGTFLEGKPLTPGYTNIVQAGAIISVLLVLEDGNVAIGECADVIFSGLAGRDPLFIPQEHLPTLESAVRPWLQGRDVTRFRANAEEIDRMDVAGKRLHTALRYGLTQALLNATAMAGRETAAEVIAREYGSQLRTEPVGNVITCVPHGTSTTVIGGPVTSAGLTWVEVQTPNGTGWMATKFLQKESSAPTSPSGAGGVKPVFQYRAFVPLASSD